MPVTDSLQSSSSKEMKHTQGSRNVMPSSHCITFSRYQIYWDMRWVVKSRPYCQHLLNISAKIMRSGGQKSMVQVDFTAQCPHQVPCPNTHTHFSCITYWQVRVFFLMKRMHRNKKTDLQGGGIVWEQNCPQLRISNYVVSSNIEKVPSTE